MKRFLSIMISAVMLILALPTFVFAEETAAVDFTVAITSTNETNTIGGNDTNTHVGKTFTATPTVTSGEVDHFTYQWYRDWTKLPNETKQTYTPGNDSLKYFPIRVYVSAYDADNTLLKTVEANLGGTAFGRMSKRVAAVLAEGADKQQASTYPSTDDANVFVVDGKRFIILDDFVSDTETYYVLADDTYGTRAFDTGAASYAGIFFRQAATTYTSGDTTYTASSGEGNIAYWLNNDFLTNGNGEYKLPQDIIDNAVPHQWHMAQNQHWKGYAGVTELETFKIALLGRADYYKYMDKFGAVVNGKTSDYWWLRDVQGINMGGTNGAAGPFVVMPWHNCVQGVQIEDVKEAYVRPAFYLGKDFFTNVKLDVDSIGANVKALIAKKYTDEELSKLYTSLEIAKIKGEEVVISDITFTLTTNTLKKTSTQNNFLGNILTATPVVESGSADHFVYKWSNTIDKVVYKTQTNASIIPSNDDAYDTYKVEITPVDADGKVVGETKSKTYYLNTPGGQSSRFDMASGSIDNYVDNSDAYSFKIDGKTFAILEETDSKTESFYVIAEDKYGTRVFDTNSTDNSTVVFKSTASTYTSGEKEYTLSSGNGNMAYWLNNDFLTNGNDGKKLPQAVIDNLTEHTYKVSQNMHWKSSSETLKVALLGKSEFLRYAGKFTAGKNYDEYWWLRDSQATNDGGENRRGPFMVICNHNIVEGRTDASQTAYVRPTFWLNETFFTDVKLDVSTMGSEVKAMLANRYTDAQLKATGYSAVEIAKIKGEEVVISSLTITDAKHPLVEGDDNGSKTGRVLTASFDTTSGKADHYIYEWSTENGVLKTQKTNTVVVPNDEAYKNFTVKVTPVDADGNAVGETVTSGQWYVSSAINPPGRVKLASYTEGNGDWTFKVDGKTFALLEESSRITDTFYVLAEDSYGKRVFDTKLPEGQDNSKTIFHPEEYTFTASDVTYTASSGEGNMAYWLNNDFLTNGNDGKKLPDAIISHLADHKYYSGATNQWKQNSAKVKVALLGRHEFLAYQGKFSIGSTEEEYWWLRDTHGCWIETMATVHGPFAVQKATVNVVQGNADKAAEYNVRPSFWLDENFFKAVKLDVNSMGKEVKAVIAGRYTSEELAAAGYNAKEIAIINGADEVVNAISDVAVSDAEGKTTVSYTYMADGSAAVEKVIVALYNGGVLAGAAIEDKTVTKGANPLTTQLDTAAYDEAKVFVWDMSTYEPKCTNGSWEN